MIKTIIKNTRFHIDACKKIFKDAGIEKRKTLVPAVSDGRNERRI